METKSAPEVIESKFMPEPTMGYVRECDRFKRDYGSGHSRKFASLTPNGDGFSVYQNGIYFGHLSKDELLAAEKLIYCDATVRRIIFEGGLHLIVTDRSYRIWLRDFDLA